MDKQQAQEQIAKLEAELSKLKEIVDNPDVLDTYHGGGWSLGVCHNAIFEMEFNSGIDDFTNYKDKNKAEQALKHMQIVAALENFKAHNDPVELDWSDIIRPKYFILYNFESEEYRISTHFYSFHLGITYFSSKELAQSAIDMLIRKNLTN